MENIISYESSFKFKPDYKWPEKGSVQACPRCNEQLELIENRKTYFGKPWWCVPCQWQFSEEDLVNGFSNDITELLTRTDLLTIINKILKGKK